MARNVSAKPDPQSSGAVPPTPRGSHETMSKRRLTSSLKGPSLPRKSTPDPPGPPGLVISVPIRASGSVAGSRASARLIVGPVGSVGVEGDVERAALQPAAAGLPLQRRRCDHRGRRGREEPFDLGDGDIGAVELDVVAGVVDGDEVAPTTATSNAPGPGSTPRPVRAASIGSRPGNGCWAAVTTLSGNDPRVSMAATSAKPATSSSCSGLSVGWAGSGQRATKSAAASEPSSGTAQPAAVHVGGVASSRTRPSTSSGYVRREGHGLGAAVGVADDHVRPGLADLAQEGVEIAGRGGEGLRCRRRVAGAGAEAGVGAHPGSAGEGGLDAPQLSPPSLNPAMSTTVVSPAPTQRTCRRPPSTPTSSSTVAVGRSTVVAVEGSGAVSGVSSAGDVGVAGSAAVWLVASRPHAVAPSRAAASVMVATLRLVVWPLTAGPWHPLWTDWWPAPPSRRGWRRRTIRPRALLFSLCPLRLPYAWDGFRSLGWSYADLWSWPSGPCRLLAKAACRSPARAVRGRRLAAWGGVARRWHRDTSG